VLSIPPSYQADTSIMDVGRSDSVQHELPGISQSTISRGQVSGPSTVNTAPAPSIPETEYISQPPSLPFSSDESGDAIALRAAISSLQFQKQKAAQDLVALEELKKQALADPERFREELVAGRLKEQRPDFGGFQDILNAPAEDGDDDDEVMLGAHDDAGSTRPAPEVPDSQPGSFSANHPASSLDSSPAPFPRIPGPQDVVRMPPINWEKYNIVGEALDALHEQQRRWPGSEPGQDNRGREHAVAAPYSPFYDSLDSVEAQTGGRRNGSAEVMQPGSSMHSPSVTGTISEHAMETRRSSKNPP
jgi:hypothetical protein